MRPHPTGEPLRLAGLLDALLRDAVAETVHEVVAPLLAEQEARFVEALCGANLVQGRSDTQYLTTKGVAEQLRCHQRTVRRWAAEGRIPMPVRVGSRLRWKASAIEAWLASTGGRP